MKNISTFTHVIRILTYAWSRPRVEVCYLEDLIFLILSRFWYHNFTLIFVNISHFFLYEKNCRDFGILRFSREYQDLSYYKDGS